MWDSHVRYDSVKYTTKCADQLTLDLEEVLPLFLFFATYLTTVRLAAGTNLELARCPRSGAGGTNACYAAFLGLHITSGSTAYLEVNTGLLACYLGL
jgi:hypothetical protein